MQTEEGSAVSARVYQDLVEVGLALLAEENDLSRLLGRVLDFSIDLSSADAGSLYIVKGQELEFSCWRNRTFERNHYFPELKRHRIPIDHSTICGHVARTGEMLSTENVRLLPPGVLYQFNDRFDKLWGYETRSLMTIPLLTRAKKVVGVLQLINYTEENGTVAPFPPSLNTLLRILAKQAAMALHNALLSDGLKQSQLETVYRLALAAEARDTDTGLHLKRVSHYARLLAMQFGMGSDYEDLIFNAAPLHDVGKIGVPDEVLKKPGRLSDDERQVMQKHTEIGKILLEGSHSPLLELGAKIALSHHEKWDGSGYPRRLASSEIPFEGRLMAVVDVFDALTCRRCYKEAWPMEKVVETVQSEKGRHFDPDMVDAFLVALPEIHEVFEQFKEPAAA